MAALQHLETQATRIKRQERRELLQQAPACHHLCASAPLAQRTPGTTTTCRVRGLRVVPPPMRGGNLRSPSQPMGPGPSPGHTSCTCALGRLQALPWAVRQVITTHSLELQNMELELQIQMRERLIFEQHELIKIQQKVLQVPLTNHCTHPPTRSHTHTQTRTHSHRALPPIALARDIRSVLSASAARSGRALPQAHGLDTDPLYESLNGSDTLLATAHLRARLGDVRVYQV